MSFKRLARENATNFEEFTSEGAWEAVVAATTHEGFVKLEKVVVTSIRV